MVGRHHCSLPNDKKSSDTTGSQMQSHESRHCHYSSEILKSAISVLMVACWFTLSSIMTEVDSNVQQRSSWCILHLKYGGGVYIFFLTELVPSTLNTRGEKGIDSETTKWCLQAESCDIVIFTVSTLGYMPRLAVAIQWVAPKQSTSGVSAHHLTHSVSVSLSLCTHPFLWCFCRKYATIKC